jgi:hypothetical protein
MPRFQTIGDIINRVAVGVGLDRVNDPFAVDDPMFVQLRTLTNECGEDLIMVEGQQWQQLERTYAFTTAPGDTGSYDLPTDFGYMIDQTMWQKASPGPAAYPLLGPGSPQWWSYLQGTQLYNVTLFAWFRQVVGKMELWPQPPAVGIPISYKYTSRHWVQDTTTTPNTYKDFVERAADLVLFEPILFVKKLKLAFLTAKGFDTTKAQDEYDVALNTVGGRDKPAPVLSLNGPVTMAPPLLSHLNVPETGIGS